MSNKRILTPGKVVLPFHSARSSPSVRVLYFGESAARDIVEGWNGHARRASLAHTVASYGASRAIYMPDPHTFSARVVHPEDFGHSIKKGRGVLVCRTSSQADPAAGHSPVLADGVWLLSRGTSFLISSADCPTVTVIVPDGRVCAAHAGRWSLLDRGVVMEGKPTRQYASVLHAIFSEIPRKMRRNTLVYVSLGIGREYFTHPLGDSEHGEANLRLIRFVSKSYGPDAALPANKNRMGKISLFGVIRQQCLDLHVPWDNIVHDGLCTYSSPGNWYSNRRECVVNGRLHGMGRNAVAVIRL